MIRLLKVSLFIVSATLLLAESPMTHKIGPIISTTVLTPEASKSKTIVKQDKSLSQGYGIITKQSAVDVNTTMNRLQKIIKKKGARFFIRINHAQNSRDTGAKNVLDSELIIFGRPELGLKLLDLDPRVGLDLPLKILAYENKDGKVYVSYRDMAYYPTIYKLKESKIPNKMSKSLNKITNIITMSHEDFKAFLVKNSKK